MGFKQGYLEIRIQVKVIIVALLVLVAFAALDHYVFAMTTGDYTCKSWYGCLKYDDQGNETGGRTIPGATVHLREFKTVNVPTWWGGSKETTIGQAWIGGRASGNWYDTRQFKVK